MEYACLGYKATLLLWLIASLPHTGGIRTSILFDFTRPALCSYFALLTIEPMLGRNLAIALLFGLTATAVPRVPACGRLLLTSTSSVPYTILSILSVKIDVRKPDEPLDGHWWSRAALNQADPNGVGPLGAIAKPKSNVTTSPSSAKLPHLCGCAIQYWRITAHHVFCGRIMEGFTRMHVAVKEPFAPTVAYNTAASQNTTGKKTTHIFNLMSLSEI